MPHEGDLDAGRKGQQQELLLKESKWKASNLELFLGRFNERDWSPSQSTWSVLSPNRVFFRSFCEQLWWLSGPLPSLRGLVVAKEAKRPSYDQQEMKDPVYLWFLKRLKDTFRAKHLGLLDLEKA